MKQIGYCCMTLLPDGSKVPALKNASATVAHVSKLGSRERRAYIHRVAHANLDALQGSLTYLATLPPPLRMFRITSGLLPLYTHAVARRIYKGFAREWGERLATLGELARQHGIRLSFHPGQYCVLNSRDAGIRRRSIEEFEYHCLCANLMGFSGHGMDDFAVNVHGGVGGWSSMVEALESWAWSWQRLSSSARHLITLENDEFGWGAADILRLCEHLGVRMVADVHHHWVNSGQWMDPQAPAVARIRATWAGATPKLHCSLPQAELWQASDQPADACAGPMLRVPAVRGTARAHALYIWHPPAVEYLQHWWAQDWSLQVEAKAKNLARDALACAMPGSGLSLKPAQITGA